MHLRLSGRAGDDDAAVHHVAACAAAAGCTLHVLPAAAGTDLTVPVPGGSAVLHVVDMNSTPGDGHLSGAGPAAGVLVCLQGHRYRLPMDSSALMAALVHVLEEPSASRRGTGPTVVLCQSQDRRPGLAWALALLLSSPGRGLAVDGRRPLAGRASVDEPAPNEAPLNAMAELTGGLGVAGTAVVRREGLRAGLPVFHGVGWGPLEPRGISPATALRSQGPGALVLDVDGDEDTLRRLGPLVDAVLTDGALSMEVLTTGASDHDGWIVLPELPPGLLAGSDPTRWWAQIRRARRVLAPVLLPLVAQEVAA